MSRPIYQTAQDLTNQEGLIKQAVFRLNPISPPPTHGLLIFLHTTIQRNIRR